MAPPKKAKQAKPSGGDVPKPAVPMSEPMDRHERRAPPDFNMGMGPPKPFTAPTPIYSDARFVFAIFFVMHLLAAFFSPIQDCDEVYNYFEPTHYLTHGSGLQTWEYSPLYAIRSWFYVCLHAGITLMVRPFSHLATKVVEFYFLRSVLGAFCAFCEARLFTKISSTFGPRIGVFFVLIMATSPGMFHASISFLPSSFSMYTTMLGMASFMDWRGGLRTSMGITWIAGGAILGWPFAAAMILPFALEEFLLAFVSGGLADLQERTIYGLTRSMLTFVVQGMIDSFFYQKVVAIPFNIVWYNVIAARAGKGPDIYGVEPWHFYVRNLLLNFNVWFTVAFISMPLLLVQHFILQKSATRSSYIRAIVFLSPFYLWFGIFTIQPHKEERFMYPAYPALALNAAVGLHIILQNLGSTSPRSLVSAVPVKLRLGFATIAFMGAVNLGLWRTLGMITAYNAPLSVYKPLWEPGVSRPGDSVCLGKEWYRFPSSFHLPPGVTPKFVKSEFSGLLPGEFSEATTFGLFPGAWMIPSGMNDENREDPGKYTSVSHCSFLVDSSFPGSQPSPLEPDYVHDSEHWERLSCRPFLDNANTGILGRLGWIPDWNVIPAKFRRQWGEYCLLRRRRATA